MREHSAISRSGSEAAARLLRLRCFCFDQAAAAALAHALRAACLQTFRGTRWLCRVLRYTAVLNLVCILNLVVDIVMFGYLNMCVLNLVLKVKR